MGFAERVVKVLSPRGESMPAGNHLAHEGGFTWSAVPEPHTRFKFPLYTADDEPIGSYVVDSDERTRFVVDGVEVPEDTALELFGKYLDYIRLTVEQPGKLARMEFETREGPHA